MSRLFAVLAVVLLYVGPLAAQSFNALTRVDTERSRIADEGDGARIDLYLNLGVPYRVFTLDDPPRLVLDFQEVDWSGVRSDALLTGEHIKQVQFGGYVPGWSRLVAELAQPMKVSRAAMTVDSESQAAHLNVRLIPTTEEAFATRTGAPNTAGWDLPPPEDVGPVTRRGPDTPMLVVLDPGHGGIDPGAETETLDEKNLMLTFARELREELLRSGGFEVVMTREDDRFVSLERRVAIAHQARADVFVSLHADSLAEGQAHGATVHFLSRDASDAASAKLAERHDRDELLSGVDLSSADDVVTDVLLDLARQETSPRTRALARSLVDGIAETGAPMNSRPLRSAAFSVLKAADIPSVLIEIGFISSARDLENLQNQEWRQEMARGIRNGLIRWRETDKAVRPLVRQ